MIYKTLRTLEEACYKIFPYTSSTYIYIKGNCVEAILPNTMASAKYMLDVLSSKGGTLIVVWEGQYRSDAFIVDDRKKFREHFNAACNSRWSAWRL